MWKLKHLFMNAEQGAEQPGGGTDLRRKKTVVYPRRLALSTADKEACPPVPGLSDVKICKTGQYFPVSFV